jgi:hypothetical protein
MRGTLSLVMAGVIAVTLGVLGSVALASSLTGSSTEAVQSVNDADTVPGAYGAR